MHWGEIVTAGCAALTVAGVAIGIAWRKLRRVRTGVSHFLDDWHGAPERPGVPARPGVMMRLQGFDLEITEVKGQLTDVKTQLGDVVAKLSPDSGASAYDQAKRAADYAEQVARVIVNGTTEGER